MIIHLIGAIDFNTIRVGKTIVFVKDDRLDLYLSAILLQSLLQRDWQVIEGGYGVMGQTKTRLEEESRNV